MNTGSIRRLYIPGELAFPKGLASAPGRHVTASDCSNACTIFNDPKLVAPRRRMIYTAVHALTSVFHLHRPKVPPKSPVIFDVQLVYIPGVSDDLEFE
jgi:hypothetical protein